MKGPFAILLALLPTACTTLPHAPEHPGGRSGREPVAVRVPQPIADARPTVVPEPKTIEDSWILDLYDWLRGDDYHAYRVEFPGADHRPAAAHLLLPSGPGPHPAVIVFPIRGGSHLVSEALAKALANRGYASLRLERRRVFEEADPPGDFATPARRLRDTLTDARHLIDWLETRPEIDGQRLATAGVSLGGILAATLMGVDQRIRAGFFLMAGGGLPELLYESQDSRLRRFREQARVREGTREAFLDAVRPYTEPLDPITYAGNIDPRHALLVTGRFDEVVPPERSQELWEAMGRPTWARFPAGHLGFVPFFWWAVGQGADLLDRVFAESPGLRVGSSCVPDC